MNPGHVILPFAQLSYAQFEAFMYEMLTSGLTVEVPAERKRRNHRGVYRVVKAIPYGGAGHKQRGIDFKCTMDDASEWVFQAKLMPKFGLDDAKAAVKKAGREYRGAKRYILLVSGIANPKAIDHVERQSAWEIWDGPTLTANFLRRIPIQNQIDNIGRAWPALAVELVARLYPLRDQVLVSAEEFYSNWLKPDRLFHHRSKLVGHADTLDELSAFLRDATHRVAILVAPGGRGKSRLLRAFAERAREQHPEYTVRFVDPLALANAQPQSLRTAGQNRFVIVQDDAHRTETMRKDLLAVLASTEGKLVLATRPQAVASLEQLVASLGFPSNQIRAPIKVPKLKLREYEALAWAELDAKHRHHAKFLARMGRDCPLVITVGASLINQDLIQADKFEERHFRNEVFARFEGDELNRLGQSHRLPLVREVLQTIAVLAPWLERELEAKVVAGFIGCSEPELQSVLTDLEAGQIVLRTGRGRRVVPDLFADHLVFTACYSDDGTLTSFAKRLAGTFARTAPQNMLRNLSEADWQALQYHKDKRPESLLDPFWDSLWQSFADADFMTRSQIVERWAAHGVYQPERSLQLCALAINLNRAPDPEVSPWLKGEDFSNIENHQFVLDRIPAVLEPIAIFQEAFTERCLDMLLGLSESWPKHRELKDLNHPWAVMARVATFKLDHPVAASQAVLAWIEKRVDDSRFAKALNEPNGILETLFSPIFTRQLDASYSEGNTFTISHPPISLRQTQPMRDHALRIIERLILPRGEIAVLNILPVLNDASQGFYATIGGNFDAATIRAWTPERLKGLAIMERIARGASGRVRWKIRSHVRHTHRGETPGSKLFKRTWEVLTQLPFTGELRDTAVCCSFAWQEMDDEPFGKGRRPRAEMREELERKWTAAVDETIRNFLRRHRTTAQCVAGLEALLEDCLRTGLNPNPYSLFNGFGRHDPALGKAIVDLLLRRKSSLLVKYWNHFIGSAVRFPDPWLQRTSLAILRGVSIDATGSLLDFLAAGFSGEMPPIVIKQLKRWARAARGVTANLAVSAVRHARGSEDPFWLAIAPELTLKRLTPEQLAGLGRSVEGALQYGEVKAPEPFLLALLAEFERLPEWKPEHGHDLLVILGKRYPLAVFNLYLNRILLSESGRIKSYQAVPMEPAPLAGLPKTKGYSKLVRMAFKAMRARPRKQHWAWVRLLQVAVVEVSPLAMPELIAWARSARKMDDLEAIRSLVSFDGSLYLLRHSDLTVALLQRGRQLEPANFQQWEARLAATMGPKVHSFSGGKRDPGQDYVSVEVNKLLATGNVSPELRSFYDAVLAHDRSWTMRHLSAPDDDD